MEDKELILFMKWLRYTDNGTWHCNENDEIIGESIGFSPYDCFIDGLLTEEELIKRFRDYQSNKSNTRMHNLKRLKRNQI